MNDETLEKSGEAAVASAPSTPGPASRARPELLAPAGDWECLRAAIENGADAVYFGLPRHNARARATNFELDDLPQVMHTLHRQGVKGYVTLNTLVFPKELAEIEELLRHVARSGVDAIIVQDWAVIRIARALCPDLPIHASTQMTMTSAEAIRLAELCGVERVILARELTLEEVARIRSQTAMPLEVFVHGALCVAYSGQCLTSEALGGRSANRGQCAQACRLPYEVLRDGQLVPLGDVQYVLSPHDLAAYALVPQLATMGITSLKIEGRLKSPEYVANVTQHYRRAIDAAADNAPIEFSRKEIQDLELSFSRGFSLGWLGGIDHKASVEGRSPNKRGIFLGDVLSVQGQRVQVRLAAPLKRGDGLVFDAGHPELPEPGGRVYEVFARGRSLTEPVSSGLVELSFARDFPLRAVAAGQRVWKTDDPELTKRLRQSFSGPPKRRLPVDLEVWAEPGKPLQVFAIVENLPRIELSTTEPLQVATRHPADEALLREQFGRLGGTVYELRNVTAHLTGGPLLPLSVLGKLRHQLVEALDAAQAAPCARTLATESPLAALRQVLVAERASAPPPAAEARLRVLCRTLTQLDSVLRANVREVYADFQDIREYRAAVELANQHQASIFLATPRIQKPTEAPLFQNLLKHRPEGILVRNIGGLLYYTTKDVPVIADFSLNVANEITAQFFLEQGAQRITASYDLNKDQLLELLHAVPVHRMEVVLHQHMPMFHMEHCVFCAVLSPGKDATDCGRPCDHHEVKLRDRVGMEHSLKADVGCRNTLFNAVPQSAAEIVPQLLATGARDFRLELLDEAPAQIESMLTLYRQLLLGQITAREVWTTLKASQYVGVTRGPLEIVHFG